VLKALTLAIAMWLLAAVPASAETFRVVGTDDFSGVCDGTQCPSIRLALAAADTSPGADRIEIPAGDYTLSQGSLELDSEVTLVGAGARTTIVRADPQIAGRVVSVGATAVATLAHLTISGGHTDEPGGNLLNDGGTVTLDHVRVTGANTEATGGGIANVGGTMNIRQSLIDQNSGFQGGGLANSAPTFLPGPLPAAGSVTVTDTTISGNTSDSQGAGIATVGDPANAMTLERVTVVGNSAGDGDSGGVYVEGLGGTIQVHGSILTGNSGLGAEHNCGGTPPTSGGDNVSAGTDCALNQTGDQQGVDPQLSARPDETGETGVYTLASGSPALDRFACTGVDQRDLARPQGTACDAGAYELDQAPDTALAGDAAGFTFSSTEPGVTFECAIGGITGFAACTSPYTPAGLGPGNYTLLVRAIDAAGQPDPTPAERTFTVAAPPAPTPTPSPTPTPTPSPVTNKSVAAEPVKGTVLIKVGGKFVPLEDSVIKNGTEIDTRKGTVEIETAKGEKAEFYDGVFKISQAGGITTLTLVEALSCPKQGKASAAAKKPKTRKLWGSGKGKFRTKGSYSAATVRGTKWLVQDSCTSTVTKVSTGVVEVEDFVKHKKLTVRKGKTYTARARR
jgi:hypothetical protein